MQQYLEAGKVVTTHGVRGEMKLELWCDGVDFLKKAGRLYASAKGGKCYNITSIRPQGQMALLQLEGVNDMDAARALRGQVFYFDRSDATLPEGRWYVADLIGCEVRDADTGKVYGVVTSVDHPGAQDIYTVKSPSGKEYMFPGVDAFLQAALAKTLDDSLTAEELTALALETGKYGVDVMAALDDANTSAYGHPEVTRVNLGVRDNPAILVSGHDLHDLEQLLEQTVGTGVDVYTHGEMLPAHYYPAFQKYPNFVGNYGNAWWQQKEEFEAFRGPILLTTNCLVPPKDSYKNRLYTTGAVGFPGCPHIGADRQGHKDFSALIAHARRCPSPIELEQGTLVGGFAHNQVLALADQVVEAVKSGAIRKFVVMAGCDGRAKSRDYYTEFAKALPRDTVILTAGCAKYKYNKLELGNINGIPRVLDAGQCNDSYSLAVIALKLQEIFGLDDINDLPIVYNIAWYEQKAVIVLLALLHLGVKNIHLGPTLPAFLSPNVAKVLTDTFGIAGIGTVEEDLNRFFG